MNYDELRDQIGFSISVNNSEGIDVEAIADELRDRYDTSAMADIDDIPDDEYWAIVRKHDATQH